MKKKFTFCLSAIMLAAGFAAYALDNGKLVPAREGEQENVVYEAPVTFEPTMAQFDQCVVLDVNEDQKTWYHSYEGGLDVFRYDYHTSNPADDWCFLPEVHMVPATYKITYTYKTRSMAENFALYLGQGTTPEDYADADVLLYKEDYSGGSWVTESTEVDITAEGNYRIALYAFSVKDKYGMYFRDIKIVKVNPDTPEIPEVSIESTGLEGIVNVTLPTLNIAGGALAAPVNATVTRDDEELPFATVQGNPGEVIEVPVTVNKRGEHSFLVRAFIELNDEVIYSEPVTETHLFTRILPTPLPMGYVIAPDEDDWAACMVIDNNEDNRTWDIYSTSLPAGGVAPKAFRYGSGYSGNSDDWLVLPQFEGVDNGAAMIQFLLGTKDYKENMEIAVATTPDVEALAANVVWQMEQVSTHDQFEEEIVHFSVPAGEPFYVAFHANNPTPSGSLWLQDIVVKRSSPLVPTEPTLGDALFDGGNGSVSLILPEFNISGAAIEGTVSADVTIDGQPYPQETSGAAGEEILLGFEGLALGSHTVTARAYIESEGETYYSKWVSYTFKVLPGEDFFFNVPCEMVLNEALMDACLIVNSNDDSRTWEYHPSEQCLVYKYTDNNGADDWLITPAFQVNVPNVEYDIQVSMKAQSSTWPETVEIFVGDAQNVDAMTTQVLEPTQVSNTSYANFGGKVVLPAIGRYFVGIHCISEAGQYYLYAKKVSIDCDDPQVGVKAAASAAGKVSGLNGVIRLQGFAGQNVTLMNMAGQVIKSGKVASNVESLVAAPGIYMVKAGSETFKVVVK